MTAITDEDWLRHMDAALAQAHCSFAELGVDPADVVAFEYEPEVSGWPGVVHVRIDLTDGRRLHVEPTIPTGYRWAEEVR